MMKQDFIGGTWLITNEWGGVYEVDIAEVSDHQGLSFSGRYRYDLHGNGMEHIGYGCFPMKEIRKMVRISG